MARNPPICYNGGMYRLKIINCAVIVPCILSAFSSYALANDGRFYQSVKPLYITESPENKFQWYHGEYDFSAPEDAVAPSTIKDEPLFFVRNDVSSVKSGDQTNAVAPKEEKGDFIDNILDKMPYSKTLKSTVTMMKGDTDLYVEGMRVDMGNKGVSYHTSTVPFVGEMDGVQFKASVGDDKGIYMESSALPFFGEIDGLKIKASAGDENKVSVRYKISLDKLGL